MSHRLQVLVEEQDLKEIRHLAKREQLTVAEWVRRAIRAATRQTPAAGPDRKLAAIRAAVKHDFPTADIDTMLAEIEHGYGPEASPGRASSSTDG
jgi:hypothetical protein